MDSELLDSSAQVHYMEQQMFDKHCEKNLRRLFLRPAAA